MNLQYSFFQSYNKVRHCDIRMRILRIRTLERPQRRVIQRLLQLSSER